MRNGHVYIQLMKQHTLQNAYFLGYSRKTDFLMLRQHEISYFDVRITAVALQTTRQISTDVFVGLVPTLQISPGDNQTKFRITPFYTSMLLCYSIKKENLYFQPLIQVTAM